MSFHRSDPPNKNTTSLSSEKTHRPIGNTTNMGWTGCLAIRTGRLIEKSPELPAAGRSSTTEFSSRRSARVRSVAGSGGESFERHLVKFIFALLHLLPKFIRIQAVFQHREEPRLFLLNVVFDAFGQNFVFGLKALVMRANLLQLREQDLCDVVLFERLGDSSLLVDLFSRRRVKDLFLESRVNSQLLQCFVGNFFLAIVFFGTLELVKKFFHLSVVFAQHIDRIR